jgi:ATP-dependent exoDNAse (exonuclease V) alpha subunit
MAIYHLHMQVISRGSGKSAVAAASYRSGDALTNEHDGTSFDYSRKGGIIHSEILLPTNAPREFSDRSTLWNAVEKIEKASNSQLAREIEIALPVELSTEQNIALARRYVQSQFVNRGMIADVCWHAPDKETPNPHAHIMLTMRPFNEDGSWGAKQRKEYILDADGNKIYAPKTRLYKCRSVPSTDWNEHSNAEVWRAAWADAVNAELEKFGHAERIDHRSYERQGVEQIPTVHLGVSVTQMERRGIATYRGDLNREIEFTNSQIKQLRARANRVKAWLDENKANTPPPLYDVFTALADAPHGTTQYDKVKHAQLMAKTLMFVQENHIGDLIDLADKVDAIRRDCTDAYERKKKVERRVATLDKHAAQCKNFTANRSVMQTYDRLHVEAEAAEKSTVGSLNPFAKGKAKKARKAAQDYYYDNTPQIEMYKSAEKYLKGVLQKRYDPKQIMAQAKKWAAERETCKQELGGINTECAIYKREVESAEDIKRFAVKLLLPDEPQEHQHQHHKSHEIGR